MRRIVQYPSSTPYSDIKISPQWHQWLRHTRSDPPSISEQSQDIIRQQNLKILAAEADARWAAKPSFLEKPGQKPLPALEPNNIGETARDAENRASVSNAIGIESEVVAEEGNMIAKGEGQSGREGSGQAPDGASRRRFERPGQEMRPKVQKDKEDPWQQARGGEKWQPAAWSGNVTVRR